MSVEDFNASHVIRVPVGAYERPESASLAYLSSKIGENAILVVVGDIAVHHEVGSVRTLNQRHVALANVDEVDCCAHGLLLWCGEVSQIGRKPSLVTNDDHDTGKAILVHDLPYPNQKLLVPWAGLDT